MIVLVSTTPAAPATMAAAEATKYSNEALVRRYAERHEISLDSASRIFEETKKFLVIMAVMNTPISPSSALDEMWHHFILHTRDYAEFCQKYFGRFLHHNPTEKPNVQTRSEMLALAREIFGGTVDSSLWPSDEIVDCDSSCSGDAYCSGD